MKPLLSSYLAQLAFWTSIFGLMWIGFVLAILWPRRRR
jgi:hypothetical protein